MNAKTAELTTNLTPKPIQNLHGFNAHNLKKKILSMGYEYISLYGGFAEYFDGKGMFLYVEDDAEFLIDYYINLEELFKTQDNYEHSAFLSDGIYTLNAKSNRNAIEIEFKSCPGLNVENLVTNNVTSSENKYVWWWRSIAHEIINLANRN